MSLRLVLGVAVGYALGRLACYLGSVLWQSAMDAWVASSPSVQAMVRRGRAIEAEARRRTAPDSAAAGGWRRSAEEDPILGAYKFHEEDGS